MDAQQRMDTMERDTMDYLQYRQRMHEILKREQDYRQRGTENTQQAHDDIDYLYTCLNQMLYVQPLDTDESPTQAAPSPQGTGILIDCDKCDGTGKLETVTWQ